MKRSEVLALIKEEVEVVLTNHEMIEFFDIDPTRLLDEMMNEQEDMKKFGQQRVTRGQQKRLRKQQAAQAGGGLEKEVTPQETGIIQSVENALSRIAAIDDLRKYKVILKSLLTKLQKKGGGAETEAPAEEMNEEEDKSFSKAGEEIKEKGTEGVFTAKAKKAGMGVQAYAAKVLAKDSKASTKTKRQASFAKGAATVARENK